MQTAFRVEAGVILISQVPNSRISGFSLCQAIPAHHLAPVSQPPQTMTLCPAFFQLVFPLGSTEQVKLSPIGPVSAPSTPSTMPSEAFIL